MILRCLSMAAVLLCATVAMSSAQPPPPAPATRVAGVTVTARKLPRPSQRETQALISDFSEAAADGRIARWADSVCPWVRGLPDSFSHFLEQRIERDAITAGALTGGKHCEPNIFVLFTPSPDTLASALVNDKLSIFTGERSKTSADLEAFLHSTDPVRVFRATGVVSSNGGDAGGMSPAFEAYNAGAKVSAQGLGPRQFAGASGSLLYTASDSALTRVVMIVDSRRTGGLTAGQVGDYLSLIALGDVRLPRTAFHPETIANLFVSDSPPDGLTGWDLSFLKSLYAAGSGARNRSVQTISMASYLNDH